MDATTTTAVTATGAREVAKEPLACGGCGVVFGYIAKDGRRLVFENVYFTEAIEFDCGRCGSVVRWAPQRLTVLA